MASKDKKEKMENQEESNQKEEQNQDEKQHNSLNYAILGGVVGAGIGLLSSPETSKKVFNSLGQSEVVRVAGKELRRTAQEIITEQAMVALRQTATGYLDKGNLSSLLAPKKKKESSPGNEKSEEKELDSSQYDELKEENKNMNDQLQRIEEMLNQLIEAKK
ncbi:GvpT/GvpP family gas vesicle accessory protein [Bacillus sp. V2I10]|uniref:GvpT/GvpP family gas vesicle accessory protein n=1 Tax=Bacillus sp. V2I10 TaxID=3042276 RepID=UPI0027808CEB|nr:GvpT/GvpP family gas vesicle accessory protein [Bacillus sp. V2I10]MDQ0861833.1 gas vesicle protein [Bacillus sp. V2I10]